MNINNYGAVFLTSEEFFDALYSGKLTTLENLFLENKFDLIQFNQSIKTNFDKFEPLKEYQDPTDSIKMFDEANQCEWFMPDNYCPNLVEHLYGLCNSEKERARVDEELTLFIQHGMFDLLFYLKYLVDTMRENKIVWGVGRGSSVASYVLYLLGVHKVDSIKYNLDIKEFLK